MISMTISPQRAGLQQETLNKGRIENSTIVRKEAVKVETIGMSKGTL